MPRLPLHCFHDSNRARFREQDGWPVPADYGSVEDEFLALGRSLGLIDVSDRGLLAITGEDRIRFLNGQATNDIAALAPGRSIYTVFVNAKGKLRFDAEVLLFEDRLWIDVEPGRDVEAAADLDKFIIADDAAVENLTGRHARLAAIGPLAAEAIKGLGIPVPDRPQCFVEWPHPAFGPLLAIRRPVGGADAIEIFADVSHAAALAQSAAAAVAAAGGRLAGRDALELLRISEGIPRLGIDMDAGVLPPEAALEQRAISYTKGCYIGQEVISRIKSVGHVNRRLRRLRFEPKTAEPRPGAVLQSDGREAGTVRSCAHVPGIGWVGMGYVKREFQNINGPLKGDGFEAILIEDPSSQA